MKSFTVGIVPLTMMPDLRKCQEDNQEVEMSPFLESETI